MTIPSIKMTKLEKIEPSTFSDKKIAFYYFCIVFILLLICKPTFILKKEHLHEKPTKISYSQLFLWQLILCTPLILNYIINY